jgi:hypothetical protein
MKNENILNELGTVPLHEETTEYIDKWKIYLQTMEQTGIQLPAYKHRPSGRRDAGRPRRR